MVCYNLHGFCDASLKVYGAFIYLQVHRASGTYVKFVASKRRVAPLSSQTIPRLELLTAVILARLAKAIKVALNVTSYQKDYMLNWCNHQSKVKGK